MPEPERYLVVIGIVAVILLGLILATLNKMHKLLFELWWQRVPAPLPDHLTHETSEQREQRRADSIANIKAEAVERSRPGAG